MREAVGHCAEQLEEAAFARAIDGPIDGDALVAFAEALALHTEIKAAPARALADGGGEIVHRLIEVEMVVFVEEDRLGRVARDLARLPDHFPNAFRIAHAVAVEEEEIRGAHHVRLRHGVAAVAGADEEAASVAGPPFHAPDQFMDPFRAQDGVIIADVALVVDLDDDVLPAAVEEPVHRAIHGAEDGGLVGQPFILSKIEDAEDDDHAEVVRAVEDALEPREVIGTQRAVGVEGGVVPRLGLRVALRRAALKIDRETVQPVPPPCGHRLDELAGVSFRIPLTGVRVGPVGRRGRIQIIEDALHHPGVEQQPVEMMSLPDAALVGRAAIQMKRLAGDGDDVGGGTGDGAGEAQQGDQESSGGHRGPA